MAANSRLGTGALLMLIAISTGAAQLAAQPADNSAYGRRLFLDKAQCSFCHGWAADGSGEPQSNGGAANLRQSFLNRDQLVEVIMCGRPGTPMPHYDDLAYTDQRCYGVTEAELGAQVPALPLSTTLQKREAEAIADYLLARSHRSRPGDARGMRGDVRARRPLLRGISRQAIGSAANPVRCHLRGALPVLAGV